MIAIYIVHAKLFSYKSNVTPFLSVCFKFLLFVPFVLCRYDKP